MTTTTLDYPADADVTEEPTVVIPTTADGDPDAPWGRKADGSPKAKPGAKPAGGPRVSASGPRKAPSPKSRPAAAGGAKKAGDGPDYRVPLVGLAQLPVALISILARFQQDEKKRAAFQLDALTIKVYAPPLAEALNNTAKTNAKLAAMLDTIVAVGPYGEIMAVVAPMVMQCMANHGAIEANPELGILSADQLMQAAAG